MLLRAEVYGFERYYTPSTIHIAVTESGGKYVIDGVSQKTIELQEGNTYVFTHPSTPIFRFSTDSGNTSAYTTGVTVNSSTQVTFVVPSGLNALLLLLFTLRYGWTATHLHQDQTI